MAVGDGLVRLRYNQLGKQTVFATAVAATKKVGWRGMLEYDPNRTQPDIDEGSIDPIAKPISGAPTIEWSPTGPVNYNEQQIRLSAALKGGVTSTGGATKTSVFTVASLTADPFDYYTHENGDDTSATGGTVASGGVIDTFSEEMPDDLGPWTFSDSWVFGAATLATDKTAALALDTAGVYVMGDDTQLYIDTAAASIGITPIVDTLHAASLTINNNLDRKRLANGSNSRKKYAGWARGNRVIELVLTFAETASSIAEGNTIDDDPVPNRFIQMVTTSGTSPYSYTRGGAFRLFSRTTGEIGGNAVLILTYRAYYDATLTYAFKATLINTVAV